MKLISIAALFFIAGFTFREYQEWLDQEKTRETPVTLNPGEPGDKPIKPTNYHPEQLTYLDDLDQHWLALETTQYLVEG